MVKVDKGVSESVVRQISSIKQEPEWMLSLRLEALQIFQNLEIPELGDKLLDDRLRSLDFSELSCFLPQSHLLNDSIKDFPENLKSKIEQANSPKYDSEFSGFGAQVESEMIFHSLKKNLEKEGVIFMSMDEAVQFKPDLVIKYFGKLVEPGNNKFAALNQAMWSGGSFLYIPKNVKVEIPLHNLYQMSASSQGQFERTIIVADNNSNVSFIEGCVASQESNTSLHAGVVEVFVEENANVRYITIQNWSKNIWNLVTKKSKVGKRGVIEWIDGNIGSGITMKYPSIILEGDEAKGSLNSFSLIGESQIIDSGVNIKHLGENSISYVNSKSILKEGAKSNFRANVKVEKNASNSKSRVECMSLFLDDSGSSSQTLPKLDIRNSNFNMEHESSLFKISEQQIQYLKSRGVGESEAISLILGGFCNSFVNDLPVEYAVDFDRLINMEIAKDNK